jgi:hypothetical protein
MSARAAFVLGMFLVLAAAIHGGLYSAGHDFVVNRFTGAWEFVPADEYDEDARHVPARLRTLTRRGWPLGSIVCSVGGDAMAGGRAFKSNVRERREAERRMKALEKRQKKEEKRAQEKAGTGTPTPGTGGTGTGS